MSLYYDLAVISLSHSYIFPFFILYIMANVDYESM